MTTNITNQTITVTYRPWSGDKLYSPDGRAHLLPCETCGAPEWVSPAIQAVTCAACANGEPEGCDDCLTYPCTCEEIEAMRQEVE
jgi:hypothetical protein